MFESWKIPFWGFARNAGFFMIFWFGSVGWDILSTLRGTNSTV